MPGTQDVAQVFWFNQLISSVAKLNQANNVPTNSTINCAKIILFIFFYSTKKPPPPEGGSAIFLNRNFKD